MKVRDLLILLNKSNPETKVLVRLDGSIYGTDNVKEHNDYNNAVESEFFVLAVDDFPDGE